MTIDDVFALPEIEGWEYSDGKSYVCSCFVVGMYKAAGLFKEMHIESTEFTPRDVYSLDFYNLDYNRPA
jgi:hypothetical protein